MTAITLIISVCFIGLAWAVFSLIRNEYMSRVRNAFIDDEFLYASGAYDKLPSYDAMLYSPRYWHLWTKQQWVKAVL